MVETDRRDKLVCIHLCGDERPDRDSLVGDIQPGAEEDKKGLL